MFTATTINAFRQQRRALEGSVAFVPTMGALHDGHQFLVKAAKEMGDHVIVSIFVNPTQFGPHEDFDKYPRPIQRDLEACERIGVTGVFNPAVDEIYPPGGVDFDIHPPALSGILEGAIRPRHFAGVCRVVAKLLNIVQPDVAVFGQKDYQQLAVIHAMVEDLAFPIRIAGMPTVREKDGLAMSSRNVYLDRDQRRHALGLFKALCEAKRMVEEEEETDPSTVESAMLQIIRSHHMEPDYAVIRHPKTLDELDNIEPKLTGGVVALVAGRLGPVRLIDNMLLGAETS